METIEKINVSVLKNDIKKRVEEQKNFKRLIKEAPKSKIGLFFWKIHFRVWHIWRPKIQIFRFHGNRLRYNPDSIERVQKAESRYKYCTMNSDDYYNRDRSYEYKVVFWCLIILVVGLVLLSLIG